MAKKSPLAWRAEVGIQGATVRARLIVRATDLPGCICYLPLRSLNIEG